MVECIQVSEEEPQEMVDHDVCFDLQMFEKVASKQNEDQTLALFRRDLELPLGESCIFLEEEQDGTFGE